MIKNYEVSRDQGIVEWNLNLIKYINNANHVWAVDSEFKVL